MPKGYTSVHKADFGPMTEEEKARFIAWAKEKEQAARRRAVYVSDRERGILGAEGVVRQ